MQPLLPYDKSATVTQHHLRLGHLETAIENLKELIKKYPEKLTEKEITYSEIARYVISHKQTAELEKLCHANHLVKDRFFVALFNQQLEKHETPDILKETLRYIVDLNLRETLEINAKAIIDNTTDDFQMSAIIHLTSDNPTAACESALKLPSGEIRDELFGQIISYLIVKKNYSFALQILERTLFSDDETKSQQAADLWEGIIANSSLNPKELEVANKAFMYIPRDARQEAINDLREVFKDKKQNDNIEKLEAFVKFTSSSGTPDSILEKLVQSSFLPANDDDKIFYEIDQGDYEEAAMIFILINEEGLIEKIIDKMLAKCETNEILNFIDHVEDTDLHDKVAKKLFHKLAKENDPAMVEVALIIKDKEFGPMALASCGFKIEKSNGESLIIPTVAKEDFPQEKELKLILAGKGNEGKALGFAIKLPEKDKQKAIEIVFNASLDNKMDDIAIEAMREMKEPSKSNALKRLGEFYLSNEREILAKRVIYQIADIPIRDAALEMYYHYTQNNLRTLESADGQLDKEEIQDLKSLSIQILGDIKDEEKRSKLSLKRKRGHVDSPKPEDEPVSKVPTLIFQEVDFSEKNEMIECLNKGDFTRVIALAKASLETDKALQFITSTLLEKNQAETLEFMALEFPDGIKDAIYKDLVIHHTSKGNQKEATRLLNEIQNKLVKQVASWFMGKKTTHAQTFLSALNVDVEMQEADTRFETEEEALARAIELSKQDL